MDKEEIITSLDIGSDSITCAVGKNIDDKIEVLYAGSKQCKKGLKNGIVINISNLSNICRELLEEAEEEVGDINITDVYAGIRGSHIDSMNNHGVYTVPRSDKNIISDDVYSVIENAKAIHLPNERTIIHVIPQEFSVDREKGFENPVGMEGNILETTVHIVTGNISHLNNISKTIANAGFSIKEHIYHIYPLAEMTLSEEEKKLGTMIIDIGDQITSIAIYYDGKIKFSKDILLGSYHITNDIAYALHIPYDEANKLKEIHGCTISSIIAEDSEIEYISMDKTTKKKINKVALCEYIKPRVEEILMEIRAIIEKNECFSYINGIVITGGGSLLKGMDRAISKIFRINDVRYGFANPEYITIKDNKYQNQKYLTAISILSYPVFIKPQLEQFFSSDIDSNGFNRFINWLKNLFS